MLPSNEAVALLKLLSEKDKADAGKVLAGLATAYQLVGDHGRRLAVLEVLATGASASFLADLRFYEADAALHLGDPPRAAAYVREAWTAAEKGGKSVPPANREAIARQMFGLASLFHRVYGTSFDVQYGQAARELFAAYLAIPGRPDVEDAKARAAQLEKLLGNKEAARYGKHDEEVLKVLIREYRDTVTACYEAELQKTPELGGKLKLVVELQASGDVASVKPDGKPGALAGVAKCVGERATIWAFPARTLPGKTRISVEYTFKRQ